MYPRLRLLSPRAILAWAGFLAGTTAAVAAADEPPPYLCKEWQVEDGLPQSHIQAIAQTRDGYLWLGLLNEGPVRFDGVRFTPLSALSAAYAGRFDHDHYVRALLGGSDGSLWVGLERGGLCRWKGGGLTVYTRAEGLADDTVRALAEGKDGTLWVGTAAGLCRFRDGAFRRLGRKEGLTDDRITALWLDEDATLWVGTEAGGLNRLRGGAWTAFGTAAGLPHRHVTALCRTRAGELWVGTEAGLGRGRGDRFVTLGRQDGLSQAEVLSLAEDRHGVLWVGTPAGVDLYRHGAFARVPTVDGLSERDAFALFLDREGGFWVGTDSGLLQVRDRKVAVLSTPEGLGYPHAVAIAAGRRGDLWITTAAAGLNRYRDGVFSGITTAHGLSSDWTTAVCEDRGGGVWVGTWGGGLNRVRGERCTTYTTRDGLAGDTVMALLQDRAGDLWIGTTTGLSRLRGGTLTSYTTRDGLPHPEVMALLEDRHGQLWVGTTGGLGRRVGERFDALTTRDGLSCGSVLCLHEDADGDLWVGTEWGGLNWLRDGGFRAFTTREGLACDTVSHILEDGRANLWLAGPKGIARVSRQQLRAVADGRAAALASATFGRHDGMRASRCSRGAPAGCKTGDGRLWFTTINGVVVIDPDRVRTNEVAPTAVIEEVLLDGASLDPERPGRARPGRGSLEFHFTASSFHDPGKVRFRYQLEGFDPAWVEAGTRRVAYYTNVPPGSYRFRVRACNSDGVWDDRGAGVELTLPPHFYQRAWFRVLCLLGPLAPLAMGYGLRQREVRARERELVRLVDRRTAELTELHAALERQNRQLAELATTDPLTGLKNRLHLREVLESSYALAVREGRPLSLVLLDVDHFKQFNDSFGHPAGDAVLREVAAAIGGMLRASDVAARYGGEEFAVLLPSTGAEEGRLVAERLRIAVADRPWERRAVTASVGVATLNPTTAGPWALVEQADRALYRSKWRGRNCMTHHEDLLGPGDAAAPAAELAAGRGR